jgi:hypothetical protein
MYRDTASSKRSRRVDASFRPVADHVPTGQLPPNAPCSMIEEGRVALQRRGVRLARPARL